MNGRNQGLRDVPVSHKTVDSQPQQANNVFFSPFLVHHKKPCLREALAKFSQVLRERYRQSGIIENENQSGGLARCTPPQIFKSDQVDQRVFAEKTVKIVSGERVALDQAYLDSLDAIT